MSLLYKGYFVNFMKRDTTCATGRDHLPYSWFLPPQPTQKSLAFRDSWPGIFFLLLLIIIFHVTYIDVYYVYYYFKIIYNFSFSHYSETKDI